METRFFSVTGHEHLTTKEVAALISSHYGDKARGIVISDVPPCKPAKAESPQQPTSFVNAISAPESFWDEHEEGSIYELAEMIKNGFPLLIDSGKYEVEQIGAVLYVRGKE